MSTNLVGGATSQLDALTVSGATTLGATTISALTTPALAVNALTGLTITTSQTTPLPGVATVMSYTHGLGVVPVSAELELVCLTAEFGYSIGDTTTPYIVPNASWSAPFTIRKNTTVVSTTSGANNAFEILNLTTGANAIPTSANWAWRFKVRTS